MNTNNKIFKSQLNLQVINVEQAWQELNNVSSEKRYGDNSIVIAVVDYSGIESKIEPTNGEVVPVNSVFCNTNGIKKIPLFFRMSTGEQNNDFSLLQSGNHGTCVAGIISATENDYSVMGVAPNIRLLSIELYELHPQNLNDRIGVSNILKHICLVPINNNKYLYNNEIYNFPEITAENAASILNFSIGIDDMNNLIYNTIDSLSIYGRTGLGAICVVAAGNDQIDFDILSEEKKYEHCLQLNKRTIVVTGANIYKKDGDIVGKYMYTNFGHRIDVTAPGNDIITTSCITLGDSCSLQKSVTILRIEDEKIYVSDTSMIKEGVCVCYFINELCYNTYVEKVESSWIILHDKRNLCTDCCLYYYERNDEDNISISVSIVDRKYNMLLINDSISPFLFQLENTLIRVKTHVNNWYYLHTKSYHAVERPTSSYVFYGYGITIKESIASIIPDNENITDIYFLYGDLFSKFSLSSAAAPHVSGVAGLILSVNDKFNYLEVKKIILDSANNSFEGYESSTKLYYGKGLLDAYQAVCTAKKTFLYDLSIENVDQSNSKKITITVKNVAESNVSSIEGAELRCLLRYVSSDNPQFTFPNFWMENNIDTYLLDTKDIEVLAKGDSVDYSIKKSEIEKYLKAIDKKKGIKPYLMFHVTPFDNGDTRDNPNENNNLYVCLLEYNDTKFLDSTGEHRLQKRFEKTDTQLSCIIKIEPSVEGWDVTQKNMKLTIRMEYMETSMEYLFRFDTDDWCYENNNDGGISLQWDAESGNTHCTIPIGQDCEKIILSTEIDGYLKICTHEIRRKSAVFSKIASALVEDMEFREKIYFFTDCDNLSNTKKYGAISSGDTDFQAGFDRYRITNVFAVEGTQETNTGIGTETTNETNSETSTPHKAYAVCKGKILVQEDKDDASLVNIVLKPEMHSSNNPAVKYFVYRGILKSSLYESDNSLKTNGNSIVSWIEKNIKEPDKRILGVELTDDAKYGDEAPIDNAFYNSDGVFELLTVPAGWCIGTFADNYIGFEIWLDTIGFNPTFSMIRNHETIIDVEQLPMNPTDGDISAHKAQKEQILNYMDPAAYFGNLYDDRIFVRNTNSEASRDGIEYSFEKVKKENLYTQIIDNFSNKNVVYIDIRNEFNTSYNYFGNYGEIKLDVIRDKEQQLTTEVCYEGSNWPIIATTFTPSFDDGVVKIAFKKGDNETPLAYAAIGERGRTLAEKIAQGKTNFVDLTAENDDYTDNSVAMVVPFRKNTAPNMENTYISVASYMRIDYLRRMKPKTPNNQETQEPQEQQEPQTPKNTENLPVWKQRESSADLLFRPMDMKLPIENVTEGFVVKVYEDEVYIDVPEHQIDYMARMGIARDPDNTYLFAVKSDLHTKNAFQMSNPRFSICSGVNKITKEQFMKYVFGGNYTKKEVQFKDGTAYIVSYQSPILNDFMSNSNEIDMNREAELLVISNENYNKLLEKIHNGGFGENSIVYISLKKKECENYNEYTMSLQEVRPSGVEEPSEPLLAIEIMKVLGDKA